MFSWGDNVAAFCNDQDFVFDKTASLGVRQQQSIRRSRRYRQIHSLRSQSLRWWRSTHQSSVSLDHASRIEPAVTANAVFADVPTLVLSGDIDTNVPTETTNLLLDEPEPHVRAGHRSGPHLDRVE